MVHAYVACHNGSVLEWPYREARATLAQNARNNGIMYISTRFIVYMCTCCFHNDIVVLPHESVHAIQIIKLIILVVIWVDDVHAWADTFAA